MPEDTPEELEERRLELGYGDTPAFGGEPASTDFTAYSNINWETGGFEFQQGIDPTPDYDPDFTDVIAPIAEELAGYELGPPDPTGMQMAQYHLEYWYRAYANRLQEYEDFLATSQQPELNRWGIPADWDYRNPQKIGPWGEYLPASAIGWTPKGTPDFGGGIMGEIKRLGYNALREWGDPGGEAEGTAIAPFHTDPVANRTINEARQLWQDGGSIGSYLGSVASAGWEWTFRTIREGWSALESTGQSPNAIGAIARGVGLSVNAIGLVADIISAPLQLALGPTVLADAEYLERQWARNGEDVPWLFEQARKWNLIGWIVPLALNIGGRFNKEYGEILEEVRPAAEMAYSAWMHPALMEDFKRRVSAGELPRHVMMDIESIGAQAVGAMLGDPLNLIDFLPRIGRIFSKIKPTIKALEVADDVSDAFKVLSAAESYEDATRAFNNATDIIQNTYRAANEGRIADVLRRGFLTPTSRYRQTVLSHNMNSIMMSALAHSGRDMDKFNDIMHGITLIGDANNAENVWRGVNILNKSNFPINLIFSDEGIDTTRLLRHFLLGKDDVLDVSKITNALTEAKNNPEQLATLFDELYDDGIRQLYPSVADRIKQNDRYLELLDTDVEQAARYLERYPLAAEEVSEFTRKMSAGHEFLQQRFFGKAATIQGHLFFTANPAYPFYNRWGNFLPTMVDSGPNAAIKGLFHWPGKSPTAAYDHLTRMLDYVPEAAGRGIGAAGAVGGEKRLFGKMAQIDEQANAAYIVANSVEKRLRRGFREGLAIPTVPDSLKGIKDSLIRIAQDTYGKVDEIKKAIRGKIIPSGRDFHSISPKVVDQLKELGLYDDYLEIARRSGDNYDDAARIIREYIEERKKLGLLASKDAPVIDLQDIPAELRQSVAADANILADLVDGGKMPIEEANKLLNQIVFDRYAVDSATGLVDNLWGDIHELRTKEIQQVLRTTGRDAQLPEFMQALSRRLTDEKAIWGGKISEVYQQVRATTDNLRRMVLDNVRNVAKSRKTTRPMLRADWDMFNRLIDDVDINDLGNIDEILAGRNWREAYIDGIWQYYFKSKSSVWANAREKNLATLFEQINSYATELGFDIVGHHEYGKIYQNIQEVSRAARAMDTAEIAEDGTLIFRQGIPNLFNRASDRYGELIKIGKPEDLKKQLVNILEEAIEEAPEAGRVAEQAIDFKMGFLDAEGRQVLTELSEEGESLADVGRRILASENAPPGFETRPIVPPYSGGMPSDARFIHESQGPAATLTEDFLKELEGTWASQTTIALDSQMESDLADWFSELNARSTELKHIAVEEASELRDFILHNYGKTVGGDVVAGYIYPYQFWHSRTYLKWMKRAIQNPQIVSKYFIYRRAMERMHPNMPDWWKYQINTNELLGLDSESPFFFGLDGALNPLKGLTGVDFNDSDRRRDWMGGVLDDLNKFGPTVWLPFTLGMALKYHLQGEEEAARKWAGRLWSPTRYIRDMTALMDPKGLGLEIDPWILLQGGIGPYEEKRVGRMLSHLQEEGTYSGAEIVDAAYSRSGPIWDEAHALAINARAPNPLAVVAPFIFGTGFKARSETDIEIDRFYNEMFNLIDMRDNLHPDEYRSRWSQLEQRYPYMDSLLLVGKSGPYRDEALAWNVLDRIPPGQKDDFAKMVGIPEGAFSSFYDNKGDMEVMSEGDRLQFMGGIINLAGILDLPDHATRGEWDMVTAIYRDMRTLGEQFFGEDIWLHEDTYYASYDPENPSAADVVFETYPILKTAMAWKDDMLTNTPFLAAYYSSINKIERFYKREMYSEAERRYGEDLWDHFEVWGRLKDQNSKAARAYWKDHPQLEGYVDFKAEHLPTIAARLEFLGTVIPETLPPIYRSGGEGPLPEAMESEDPNEAWISAQVMEYLSGYEAEIEEEHPTLTLDEQQLRDLMGEPLFRLWQMGGPLPEIARRRLMELGLNEDGTIAQPVAPTPEPTPYGAQPILDDEFGPIPEDPISLFGQALIDRGLNEVKENQGGLTTALLGDVVDAGIAKGYHEDEIVAWFIEAVGARDPRDVPQPSTGGGFIPENIRLGGMFGPEAMVGQQVENIFSETTALHAAVGYNRFTTAFHRLIDKIGAIATREGETPGYVWQHSSPHIKSYTGEGPMTPHQRAAIIHEFGHKAGDESNIDWDDFEKSVNRVLAQEQDPRTIYYTTVRRISEFPGVRLDTRGQDYEWGGYGELYASMFEWTHGDIDQVPPILRKYFRRWLK